MIGALERSFQSWRVLCESLTWTIQAKQSFSTKQERLREETQPPPGSREGSSWVVSLSHRTPEIGCGESSKLMPISDEGSGCFGLLMYSREVINGLTLELAKKIVYTFPE